MAGISTAVSWYLGVDEEDVDYQIEDAKIAYAVALQRLMDEKGVKKSELAKLLGSSAAYVTKVLRGDANFTIETMVKLAHVLGGRYCHDIVWRHQEVQWVRLVTDRPEETNRGWLHSLPALGEVAGVNDDEYNIESATLAA